MNFKDMVCLKWKNIKGETFSFIRQKTKNTSNGKNITVYISPETQALIDKWGIASSNPDDYVFGIIDDKMTLLKKDECKMRRTRQCNEKLAEMGKTLGFNVHLCLNLARH